MIVSERKPDSTAALPPFPTCVGDDAHSADWISKIEATATSPLHGEIADVSGRMVNIEDEIERLDKLLDINRYGTALCVKDMLARLHDLDDEAHGVLEQNLEELAPLVCRRLDIRVDLVTRLLIDEKIVGRQMSEEEADAEALAALAEEDDDAPPESDPSPPASSEPSVAQVMDDYLRSLKPLLEKRKNIVNGLASLASHRSELEDRLNRPHGPARVCNIWNRKR